MFVFFFASIFISDSPSDSSLLFQVQSKCDARGDSTVCVCGGGVGDAAGGMERGGQFDLERVSFVQSEAFLRRRQPDVQSNHHSQFWNKWHLS